VGGLKHENNTLRIRWYLSNPLITTNAINQYNQYNHESALKIDLNVFVERLVCPLYQVFMRGSIPTVIMPRRANFFLRPLQDGGHKRFSLS